MRTAAVTLYAGLLALLSPAATAIEMTVCRDVGLVIQGLCGPNMPPCTQDQLRAIMSSCDGERQLAACGLTNNDLLPQSPNYRRANACLFPPPPPAAARVVPVPMPYPVYVPVPAAPTPAPEPPQILTIQPDGGGSIDCYRFPISADYNCGAAGTIRTR
ncbi:MAG TPA: hypothetical protein VF957_23605 [Bradyrhizobium sp.]